MKFGFVAKHRVIWPVSWICGALGVSRSGFHAWLNRSPSKRALDDEVLLAGIRSSFSGSDRTYGSRRVWHDVLAEGLDAGLHRIERLMRQEGLRSRPRRRGLPKDVGQRHAASPNILDRTFEASVPNQKWIADFTYIWTAQGWLYVAAVIDLFSRRVVGWSMSAGMTAQLVTDALIMAIWRRGNRRSVLLGSTTLAAASVLGAGGPIHVAQAQQSPTTDHRRPNILLMLADNVGNGVPSCYNGGILDTPTPRTDRLAAEGL
jgi:putative transposase